MKIWFVTDNKLDDYHFRTRREAEVKFAEAVDDVEYPSPSSEVSLSGADVTVNADTVFRLVSGSRGWANTITVLKTKTWDKSEWV